MGSLDQGDNPYRSPQSESNEGHVGQAMGAGFPMIDEVKQVMADAHDVLPKASAMLTRAEKMFDRLEKFWLFKLLGL